MTLHRKIMDRRARARLADQAREVIAQGSCHKCLERPPCRPPREGCCCEFCVDVDSRGKARALDGTWVCEDCPWRVGAVPGEGGRE